MNEITGYLLIVNILLILIRLHRLEKAVFYQKKEGEQDADTADQKTVV